jgi:phosphomannomutase
MSVIDQTTGLAVPRIKVKFGTAGIRGIYGQEVSIRETIAVCYAVHTLLGEGRFGLGYDSRKTSVVLANVASSAMNWYGSDVEDYGMIPTPVLAFNIKKNKLHAGFSVTASHNPPEYAGVKVFGTDGIEFSLEAEQQLEQLVLQSEGYTKREEDIGVYGSTLENEEAVFSYKEALLGRTEPARKHLKILVDCANGTSGGLTPKILEELGHHVVTVNAHPSERFPGRLPEPMVETLGEVASLTRAIHADFAIAHDGDADRLVMIDHFGKVVPDYALSTLVLKIIVEKAKKGNVIFSVNSSSALEKTAEELGCKVQRSRLGKTFEELYKRKGIFASEPSKMVDPRWGYWEDGVYTGVLVAQYLAANNIGLSDAISGVPIYHNLQRNLQLNGSLDYNCVKAMMKSKLGADIEAFDELDGVKAYLKGGAWIMVRSSGTEKKVRVYVESPRESEAVFLLQDAVNIANSCAK